MFCSLTRVSTVLLVLQNPPIFPVAHGLTVLRFLLTFWRITFMHKHTKLNVLLLTEWPWLVSVSWFCRIGGGVTQIVNKCCVSQLLVFMNVALFKAASIEVLRPLSRFYMEQNFTNSDLEADVDVPVFLFCLFIQCDWGYCDYRAFKIQGWNFSGPWCVSLAGFFLDQEWHLCYFVFLYQD